MISILQKEITDFFNSLTAYITIGVFLLATGLFLWVFPESSILEYGYAGLESLFNIAPYLFMFLIPAITMRSVAEEKKAGTFELLATRPLTDWQIILGKYLASLLVVLLTLVPTVIYYITIYQLGVEKGNIDSGAVTGSYIGLFLLGGAFTAIGIFASAVSRNQIVAFMVSVFLCYFLFTGFESVSRLISLQSIDTVITAMGINEHYQSISRGVLDTRDLVYFLTVIAFFLVLTRTVLGRRLTNRRKSDRGALLLSLALIVVVNFLAAQFFSRIDFTKEKRYTLSPVTRNILGGLNDNMQITIYLEGDFPAGFKRLRNATRDLLTDYKAYAGGRLRFDFVNPLKGDQAAQSAVAEELAAKGITPTNLSVKTEDGLTQKLVYPAALITYGGRQIPVRLFQTRMGATPEEVLNNSVQNLEYAFSSAIQKISRGGAPRIGFTEGHGELDDSQLADAMKSLQDGYEVGRVDLNVMTMAGLDKLDVLIVPKPATEFSEAEKYKIDYFVMKGGSVFWALDHVNAELDSLRGMSEQLAFPNKLNLDDMLFKYGVRINYDLVADMNCAQIPISLAGSSDGGIQMVPWLFYPIFVPTSPHPLVKNLDGIRSEFASTIDTIAVKGLRKTIILSSSPFSRKLAAPTLLSLQMLEQEPDPKEFQSEPKPVGVVLEGIFGSTFVNRPVPAEISETVRIPRQSKPGRMIVVADGDILKNQVSATDGSTFPLGYDRYTSQQFGNRNFLLNA
ncbi:MAG TPA: gliding motility-associated ABC transporter substrate-binding protein GldG, partial [Sphingobacteriaceae bacterium]